MADKRTRRKTASAANPIMTQGLLAAGVAVVGLLVAFGLIWWQLIIQPDNARADLERDQTLQRYAEYYNGRITELRQTVGTLAQAANHNRCDIPFR